jgi:AcrR family transcriptional regulator
MTKGAATRNTILDTAVRLSSIHGLHGITIGQLADELQLSKSGLFAHFKSKEALQRAVLEQAADRFEQEVIDPALEEAPGAPRLRAFFDRWLTWISNPELPGGCVFITAAVELDDQPGPARGFLVRKQNEWIDLVADCAAEAIEVGHFRPNLDGRRFAQEMYGLLLANYHFTRLLEDYEAEARARAGFEFLLARSRVVN